MTAAAPLAALSAATGVWGAWEALRALEAAAPARRVALALTPLRRPGREPTPPERRRLALLGVGALSAAGWLLGGVALGAGLGAAGPVVAAQLLAWGRRRWRAQLADGAPAVARALADALSGGHGLRGAIAQAAGDGAVTGPAAEELHAAARRLALGVPTDTVLEQLRRRAADPAWDTLVAAMLLQRDAGGDLAGLLRSVAAAQEQARRVEGEARGLTSQARATAKLVAILPVAGLAIGELLAPGSLAAVLADPRSRLPALAGLALGAAALAVIARLARSGGRA